jgi:hypothetical protein
VSFLVTEWFSLRSGGYYYAELYVNFNELVTDLSKQYKVKRGGEKHVGES